MEVANTINNLYARVRSAEKELATVQDSFGKELSEVKRNSCALLAVKEKELKDVKAKLASMTSMLAEVRGQFADYWKNLRALDEENRRLQDLAARTPTEVVRRRFDDDDCAPERDAVTVCAIDMGMRVITYLVSKGEDFAAISQLDCNGLFTKYEEVLAKHGDAPSLR